MRGESAVNAETLKSPYPWFGSKSRVADVLWRGLGPDVNNYVEPFFGSNATLLRRPGGAGKIETINDADRYVANFWRAVTLDPEAVARHADWPVNEADMHARHEWLLDQADFRERMHSEPDYFDARIAGWWVWGRCMWIGSGWCAHADRGRPDMSSPGRGVHQPRQLPALSVTHGTPAASGIHSVSAVPCEEWFRHLQHRMRRVRVACGDWKRVLSPGVLGKSKDVGGRRSCAVLLDPPYDMSLRSRKLYSEDTLGISAEVREWALAHGDDPELRIALCGYEGEHEMPSSWTVVEWKGAHGYAGADNDNRSKERIWFSPHCLPVEQQRSLFEVSP